MASYIQGVTDYIPNVTFNPDYNFFQGALATKQAQYDQGWQQINSVYSSILNAPLTRESNQNRRDEWLSKMESQLRQISNSDLSLPQNVDAARNVFKPFYEDDHIVYDMTWTNHWNKEMQRSEYLRTCLDDDKCGDKYWEGGQQLLNIARQEFANTSDDESLRYGMTNYVDNFDMMKEATKMAKDAGFEIIQEMPNGKWMVKQKNGDIAVKPLADFISASMSNNSRAINYYKGKAKLLRKADEASYLQMYNDIQMANQARANSIRNAQQTNNRAADRVNAAKREIEQEKGYIEGNNVRKDTPRSILNRALQGLEEDLQVVSQSAERINADADRTNKAVKRMGLEGLIQNPEMSDALIGSALMNGDIMNSAYAIAHINTSTELEANPYYLEEVKHQNTLARQRDDAANKLFKEYVTGKISFKQIEELRALEGYGPKDPVVERIAQLEKIKLEKAARNISNPNMLKEVSNVGNEEVEINIDGLNVWNGVVTSLHKGKEEVIKQYDKFANSTLNDAISEYNNSQGQDPGSLRNMRLLGDQLKKIKRAVQNAEEKSGVPLSSLSSAGLTVEESAGLTVEEMDKLINSIPSSTSDKTQAYIDNGVINGNIIAGFIDAADDYLRKTTGTGISLTASGSNLEGSGGKQLAQWLKYQNYDSEYATDAQVDKYQTNYTDGIRKLQYKEDALDAIHKNLLDIHKNYRARAKGSENAGFVNALITEEGGFRNKADYLNNINYKAGYSDPGLLNQSPLSSWMSDVVEYPLGVPTPGGAFKSSADVKNYLKTRFAEEGITLSDEKLNEFVINRDGVIGYNKFSYNKAIEANEKWDEITDDFGNYFTSNQLSGDKVWMDNEEFQNLGGLSGKVSGMTSGKMNFSLGTNTGDDKIMEDQAKLFMSTLANKNLKSANSGMFGQSKADVDPGTISVYVEDSYSRAKDPQQAVNSVVSMYEADYSTKEGVKPNSPRQSYKVTPYGDGQIEVEITTDNMGSSKYKAPSKMVFRLNAADVQADPELSRIGFLSSIINDESKDMRTILRAKGGELKIPSPGGSAGGSAKFKGDGAGKAQLFLKQSRYDVESGKIVFDEKAYVTNSGEPYLVDINNIDLIDQLQKTQFVLSQNKTQTEIQANGVEFFQGLFLENIPEPTEADKISARRRAVNVLKGLTNKGLEKYIRNGYNPAELLLLDNYEPETQAYLQSYR